MKCYCLCDTQTVYISSNSHEIIKDIIENMNKIPQLNNKAFLITKSLCRVTIASSGTYRYLEKVKKLRNSVKRVACSCHIINL